MSTISPMVQVCLICLETESKLYVMNKYNLEKAYENLIGYSISDEEHMVTKFLCAECMHRLMSFSKFRYKSLRARSVMEELLNYQQITLDYIKLVDRDKYQLKSDIEKTVFEPNHCDLYVDCSDTDVIVEGGAVKCDERLESVSIDEKPTQQHMKMTNVDHDANRQTKIRIFEDTKIKIEKNVYKDRIDIESDIGNEYDPCYNTNYDVTNDDNLSDSTLVLDTKPTIEELLDQKWNPWIENTHSLDLSSESNNGNIKENTNRNIEDTKLDNMSSKNRKKLQETLEFETKIKNFTQHDEFKNENKESKLDDTKNVSRIKIDEFSNHWESKSDKESNLLVKREAKQNLAKLKTEAVKPYTCTICNYKCKLKISLTVHMRTHKDDKYFSCELCDYKSKLRHSMNIHMMKHTAVEAYICDICDTKIKNKNNLHRHMKIHFGKTLACNLCEYKTKIKRNLVQHVKNHSGSQSYSCQLCDHKFFRKDVLKMHMWSHTNEKVSNNELKDLGTNMTNASDKISSCELEGDKRNAPSDKRYTCTLCSSKFLMRGHLNRHMLTHTGEKPFVCPMCENRFSQKVSLERHMLIHNKEKPFSCDYCPYRCVSNIDMVKHIRTHTGEKPYACTYCEFRCNTSYNLITHTRSHTGEKPFACKLCVYKCTRTSQLVRHMRTHTGEKRFTCDICHYKCTRRCNLLMHMRVHTGEMLLCDYCSYKTANKNCLVVHIKRHMQLIAEGKVNH